jgi:GDP-mannose 6-dehydrogenase
VGADDEQSAAKLRELYAHVDAPFYHAPINVAEMIKYVNNSYHALKVAFANEVGVGLSFKAGTDDLRESPLVDLVEALLGKGYQIRIYDRNVNLARLMGANKSYIEHQIPHVSQLFVQSISELLEFAECVVIGNSDSEFRDIPERVSEEQIVVDLVRVDSTRESGGNYQGICW